MKVSYPIKNWPHFINILIKRFQEAGCNYRAAALTFTSLLSLVPLMTVSFGILAAFPEFRRFGQSIQDFVFSNFVATSGQVIQSYLQTFVQHAAQLSAIGLFFLLITSISMMFTLEQTLNVIWRVRAQRPWISALLLYWTMLTLSPILIGVGFAVSSYLATLSILTTAAKTLGLTKPLLAVAPFLLSVSAFTLLYIAVPNCKVQFRYGFIGALTAGVLFEIAKYLFTFYVTHFPTYEFLYGALAAIPIFLLWVYVCWLITLIGAVVSNTLFTNYDNRGKPNDAFTQAVRWLGHFWRAQQLGNALSLKDILALERGWLHPVAPEEQLHVLVHAKLIQPTQGGNYILSRDFTHFTLADLQQTLPWPLPKQHILKLMEDSNLAPFCQILSECEQHLLGCLQIPLIKLYASNNK